MPSAITIPRGRPEHISLDFDRLRSEGIQHLENLATEIWTDFNAGEPGITILETLCYAITDLGFRATKTPIADIAAGDGKRKVFFSPEEILTGAPVTVNDFRKLLIDVDGVKNAWLEEVTEYVCGKEEWRLWYNNIDLIRTLYKIKNINDSSAKRNAITEFVEELFAAYRGDPKPTQDQAQQLFDFLYSGTLYPTLKHFTDYLSEQYGLQFLSIRGSRVKEIQDKTDPSAKKNAIKEFVIGELFAAYRGKKPTEAEAEALFAFLNSGFPNQNPQQFIEYLICRYGSTEIDFAMAEKDDNGEYIIPLTRSGYKNFNPKGLYHIVLDLDDDIKPIEAKEREAAIRRARMALQANRELCHDYRSLEWLETEEIAVCLDLELEDPSDERKVLAEVLYRLQDFLTPTVRFYSLKEMLDKGFRMDEIYNGPLLKNGFIDDAELELHGKKPNPVIKRSDLYNVLSPKEPGSKRQITGLKSVNNIKVQSADKEPHSWEEWNNPVEGAWRTNNPALTNHSTFKYRINPNASSFTIKKGRNGERVKIKFPIFKDEYDRLVVERSCKYCSPKSTQSPASVGRVRNDLARYESIQHDFPAVYRVGDHQLQEGASADKIGPMRQLQAYLMFFDQILAAYLTRLSDLSKLLAVQQDPRLPSYVLPPLFETPGARQLLEARARIMIEEKGREADRKDDWDALAPSLLKKIDPNNSGQMQIYTNTLAALKSAFPPNKYTTIPKIRKVVRENRGLVFMPVLEDYFWNKFVEKTNTETDPNIPGDWFNNFRKALAGIAENNYQRQTRRNILLDHLLARFGERFTDFVLSLLDADINPEDNPGWNDFDDYLQAKATYLLEVPGLGAHRGRAYNYRAWNHRLNRPDVWNTGNVAGVKKRVSRLLELDVWRSETLLVQPPYTLDVVMKTQNSVARFYVALRRNNPGAERLDRSDNLMVTPLYSRKQHALDARRDLYKVLDEEDLFSIEKDTEDESKYVVQFLYNQDGVERTMRSDPYEKLQAREQLKYILSLVTPREHKDYDGFHLLEHILLRPNEERDELLQIPLYGIDPPDPYSNIVTIVAPNWTARFRNDNFRIQFEKAIGRELPCYVMPRFCWVNRDLLQRFEDAFKLWMEEKSKCANFSECKVTDAANALIKLLNEELRCAGDCDGVASGKPCE